ncbi:MAG TPA: hypothetical protein VHD83_26330 [Puia sp.]|nr:hypothetical protein [Puia sp.]
MQDACSRHVDFRILIGEMILENYLFAESILNLIHRLTPLQRYRIVQEEYAGSDDASRQDFASCLGLTKKMVQNFLLEEKLRKDRSQNN